MPANETNDFEAARKRLDEIVGEVRSKDLSLEKSLDLYEEAIRLGTTCSRMIDKSPLSDDERVALSNALAEQTDDGLDEGATGAALEEALEGGDTASGTDAAETSAEEAALKDPDATVAFDAAVDLDATVAFDEIPGNLD